MARPVVSPRLVRQQHIAVVLLVAVLLANHGLPLAWAKGGGGVHVGTPPAPQPVYFLNAENDGQLGPYAFTSNLQFKLNFVAKTLTVHGRIVVGDDPTAPPPTDFAYTFSLHEPTTGETLLSDVTLADADNVQYGEGDAKNVITFDVAIPIVDSKETGGGSRKLLILPLLLIAAAALLLSGCTVRAKIEAKLPDGTEVKAEVEATTGPASAGHDPHFVGFNGQHFDFQGEPNGNEGRYYMLVYDEAIDTSVVAHFSRFEGFQHFVTYMTNIGVHVADMDISIQHPCEFAVQRCNTSTTYAVPPVPVVLGKDGSPFLLDSECLPGTGTCITQHLSPSGSPSVTIITDDIMMVVTTSNLGLNLVIPYAAFSSNVHGILGQTATMEGELVNAGPNGEGVLAGHAEGYEVNDVFDAATFQKNVGALLAAKQVGLQTLQLQQQRKVHVNGGVHHVTG